MIDVFCRNFFVNFFLSFFLETKEVGYIIFFYVSRIHRTIFLDLFFFITRSDEFEYLANKKICSIGFEFCINILENMEDRERFESFINDWKDEIFENIVST